MPCKHWRPKKAENYLYWHLEYAPAHKKKYGKQRQCPKCKKWLWPDEWVKPRPAAEAKARAYLMALEDKEGV